MNIFRSIIFLAVTLFVASAPAQTGGAISDLHWAALEGDVAEVKRLVAAGADVNATDNVYDDSPLYWAVRGGSTGAVRALVAAGAVVNGTNGSNPLSRAVTYGAPHYRTLLALLAAGADPASPRSEAALTYAVRLQSGGASASRAVWLLRKFGVDPNHSDGEALRTAVAGPWERVAPVLRALNDTSLDPNGRALDFTLRTAADLDEDLAGDLGWVEFFFDLDKRFNSARDPLVLEWLLQNGAVLPERVNTPELGATFDGSPLSIAVGRGWTAIARVLRLHIAAERGY